VEIHYGGGMGWRSLDRSFASVGVRNNGRLTIHNATITNSEGDAIMTWAESGYESELYDCANLSFENIEGENITLKGVPAESSECKQ